MKSRLLLNLGLLALLAILAAVAFFEPGKSKSERQPIAQLDEDALSAITLRNKETIVFEKKDGHWRLAAPFPAPANEIRIRQLMDIAKAGIDGEYPLKPEDLARFELDKPKAMLVLGDTTLEFGGSDPINLRRYVRKGDTLYLVSDDFFHHLMAGATDYVDKKLLPENAKVTEIFIPGLKATLGQDGKWTREPSDNTADLGELTLAWTTARAIEVRRPEQPVQGDVVRIGLAESPPIEFLIVQREPDLVLAREDLGLSYELTGDIARQLLNLPKPAPAAGRPAGGEEADAPGNPDGAEDNDRDGAEPADAADPEDSRNPAEPELDDEGEPTEAPTGD